MSDQAVTDELRVSYSGHVGTLEINRPPHNFFDAGLIHELASALERFDADPECRCVVLGAAGKSFCAGADLTGRPDTGAAAEGGGRVKHLYKEALRLFRTRKPVVAAIHGAAVGGGLGLALVADFRVTCPEARFSANFTRLGFHPGFGLTASLPRLIGPQRAALMFLTARRVRGEEAVAIGLADVLVPRDEVRTAAAALAREIAQCAPLAVLATRETLRRSLADLVAAATERELVEQEWLRRSDDFKEGVAAMAERRMPNFLGR